MALTERAYLSLVEFKARSIMPPSDVDALETEAPGFVDEQIASASADVDSALSKRYATPIQGAVPRLVQLWVTRLVTLECYLRRGFNPSAEQDALVATAAERTRAELQQAADGNNALRELPLRADAAEASGVVKGGPFGYSEASPWVGFDLQRAAARAEDERGSGT
jgi:hypothetical protein